MPPPGAKQKKPATSSPPDTPVVSTPGAEGSSVPDSEANKVSLLVEEESRTTVLLGERDDIYRTLLLTLSNDMTVAETARSNIHSPVSWYEAWVELLQDVETQRRHEESQNGDLATNSAVTWQRSYAHSAAWSCSSHCTYDRDSV